MKAFYWFIFSSIILFSLTACEMTEDKLVPSANETKVSLRPTEETIIIYDQRSNGQGIRLTPVNIRKSSGNFKVDVVQTFLENNHIINSKNKVTLLRIEDFSDATTFYLSSIEGLGKPEHLQLFKEALELTIMRQLKNDDFNIIYGQTAHL